MSITLAPDLTVVVPLFNEEENVEALYEELKSELERLERPYEILFVDDGSRDGTSRKLLGIRKHDRRVRVLRFGRNFGQTAAMQAGFDHARGEVVITMDGDLQNDPRDIPRLLQGIDEGFDLVVGWRRDRKDSLLTRKIPSWCANWIIGRITGVRIHDNGCSLKAYRGEIVSKTRLYGDMHRFIPAMMSLSGSSCKEIVVNHRPRRAGTSKYGLSRTLKVLSDLLVVKMLTGFTTRPALWFCSLSLPFLFLSVLFLVLSGHEYVTLPEEAPHSIVFPASAVLFSFAFFQLLLIGMAAELTVWAGDYREADTIVPVSEGR